LTTYKQASGLIVYDVLCPVGEVAAGMIYPVNIVLRMDLNCRKTGSKDIK
jgi:hypothetical protein